jgi:glycosyltransferase involved in cell wall biosynthesis
VNLVNLDTKRVFRALIPLVRYLRRNRPAVLITHLRHANIVALLAVKFAAVDTKIVVVEHSVLSGAEEPRGRESLLPWLMKKLYPAADVIVAVSEGGARDLEQRLGLKKGRVRSIYNPVVDEDLSILSAFAPSHPWLADKEGPVFLAIGRLSREKDFKSLLEAFCIVRERLLAARGLSARLVILGEGPERGSLEAQIVALGLENGVSLPGFVKNPYSFLSRADAFVHSSRYEGLSNVVIEALACGCPVIATDCPVGPAEILRNGEFGTLVPLGDIPALAQAMIEVIGENIGGGAEIAKIGASSRREQGILRAAGFSTERSAAAYLSLVDELTMNRRPASGGQQVSVLHIIAGLETGGAEIMLCNLLSRMSADRHAVLSLSGDGALGARLREQGITVYHLGIKPGSLPSPREMGRLIRLLRGIRPRIIQGWMYHGNLAASFARPWLRGKPPVIWGIHHSIGHLEKEKTMTRAMIRLGARLSGLAARIIYVSESSRRQHRALGYRGLHALTIPNGIDTARFLPAAEARASLLDNLGLPEGVVLIGLFARFHPMKDQAGFLKAAAIVNARHGNTHFVMAGNGIDPDNRILTDQARELGISDCVHYMGPRKDIEQILPALDIYCQSSAYGEALPLILLEAMSCEVPVVTTAVGDAAAVVGGTGLTVNPQDPAALATALCSLTEAGNEARKVLGKAARERVIRHYSLETSVEMYLAVYRKLIDAKDAN